MSATLAARARPDATLSMPRRAAGARKGPSALARLARWFGRRPGRAVVVLLFVAASATIALNALLFQKGRHPAPMLSQPAPQTAARPTERRVDAPPATAAAPQAAAVQPAMMPPSRPGDLTQGVPREAVPRPPAAVAPAQPRQPQPVSSVAVTRPAPAAQPAARDPIADLINGSDLRPPAEIRGAATARAPQARRNLEN